jgi:hypothetical protein
MEQPGMRTGATSAFKPFVTKWVDPDEEESSDEETQEFPGAILSLREAQRVTRKEQRQGAFRRERNQADLGELFLKLQLEEKPTVPGMIEIYKQGLERMQQEIEEMQAMYEKKKEFIENYERGIHQISKDILETRRQHLQLLQEEGEEQEAFHVPSLFEKEEEKSQTT